MKLWSDVNNVCLKRKDLIGLSCEIEFQLLGLSPITKIVSVLTSSNQENLPID